MSPPRPAKAAPEPAVSLRGLGKRFGSLVAVDRIDLDVPAGSFFGLLGPNGAGKTTTLKMVTGLLRPDVGTACVLGEDVWRAPVSVKAQIGVLPEGVKLFDRLTGAELLLYTGLLRGMDRTLVDDRSLELATVLNLLEAGNKLVLDYSYGMRKKLALAAALLHAPRVLFLDEPFEGVDAVTSGAIRDVLRRYTASGGTVVFSSHVLDVVQSLCDRIAILHRGRVVVDGELGRLRRGRRTLEAVFLEAVGASPVTGEELSWLGSSSG